MHLTLAGGVLLLSAATCAAVAAIAWSRRSSGPQARYLAATLLGTVVWSLGAAVLQTGADVDVLGVGVLVAFLGIYAAVTGFWCFARVIADPRSRIGARRAALLAAGPVLLIAGQVTDAWHHLFFTSVTELPGPPWLVVQPGPLLTTANSYALLLVAWSVVRLALAWYRAPAVFRRQIGPILVGASLPLAAGTVTTLAPQLTGGVDYTPVWLTVTGLLAARAQLRHGLVRVNRVHRDQVVEAVADAVIVIDPHGVVVDLNPAAEALVARLRPGLTGQELVGRDARTVLPRDLVDGVGTTDPDTPLEPLPGVFLDVRSTALVDDQGRHQGVVLVGRDVTQTHLQRRALAAANDQLRDQLGLIEVLRAQLAEDAVRDPLTGLHNRRHLQTALGDALARGRATGTPTGLLLVDVDHFKRVNDHHGHAAGDTVLQAVAGALIAATRPGDVLARWGGEEFVLVLPGADDRALVRRAEELRLGCRSLSVEVGDLGGAAVSLTVSVGAASHPVDAPDAVELMQAADAALYRAKARGRNRVVLAARGVRQPV